MKKAIFLSIFISIISLAIGGSALAIGMITEPIVISDILRGGQISEKVTMFNPQDKEVIFLLGTTGQIDGWVTFFEEDDLNTPILQANIPAKEYYDVIAKITVPQGTPNGKYTGEIYVKQEAEKNPLTGGSEVAVAQMVSRSVTITVTDKEVVKLEATVIPEKYDVAIGDSLKIKIIYENLGNISLKPSYQLKITDVNDGKTVFNAIFPYSETEEAVKPGERKTMPTYEWPTAGQIEGKYRATITTLLGDEVLDENDFLFNIGKAGVLGAEDKKEETSNKFLAAVSAMGGGNMTVGWIIMGGILLLFLAALNFIVSKRKKVIDNQI